MDGNLLTDPEEIKERWREYIQELYAKAEKPGEIPLESEEEVDIDRLGLEILKESEIIKTIHHLTDGKSEGADGIPAEMWKTIGTVGVDTFVELCSNIYRTRVWPEDWVESVLIPIEKKSQTTRCEEHRTISLIAH